MKLLYTSIFTLFTFLGFSQTVCNVTVTPTDTTICPGDSIQITALASIVGSGQSFNFDGGVLPPGWSTTGSATYTQPCGAGPNGSNYFWAATAGSGTPTVTTAGFDVSCGGFVVFEMKYAVQGGASPCEGPDLANEGVELQYSTNGTTWISLRYWSPGGFELPSTPSSSGSVVSGPTAYTVWNNFSVPIPLGAMTQNTQFRWIQFNSSGTCCDNWGLEDISIQAGPCNSAFVDWNGDAIYDSTSFYYTPTADTFFIADVYDTLGVLQCVSDTVFLQVNTASLTYDLVDTVFSLCRYDTINVEVLNLANANAPYTFAWSNGSDTSSTDLYAAGNIQDTIIYNVDITDGCGFVYPDSVIMIVNQILSIDTAYTGPSNACDPTGWVSFAYSGDSSSTTPPSQPFFNLAGPNDSTLFITNGTAQQNLSSGWYYFTIEDDYCFEYDSAYVDIENPPIANLDGSPLTGCGPLEVSFTNTSENTNDYFWDFGDGTSYSIGDLSSQTHTFNADAQVMLIAYADPNCADTAYVNVLITPCGCTDPSAENYDPNALQNDGSCIYPIPTVIAPNVFTPNGDGDNDVFVLTTTKASDVQLLIVNRWGNVMFDEHTDDSGVHPSWDGKTKAGADAGEGTYFYRYVATGVNGDEVEGHGFLQLVRD